MPPNSKTNQPQLITHIDLSDGGDKKVSEQPDKLDYGQIVWPNVATFAVIHLVALYGLFLCITSAMWATTICAILGVYVSGFGAGGGAHRLWSHRAFKATWQLQCIMLYCQTYSIQYSVIWWARDHRAHHKYSETDGDPHNAKRGFFFSHIGWLLSRKHKDVIEKGRKIDVSDLKAQPLLRFQDKYYAFLALPIGIVIPTLLPMLLWKETLVISFCANIFRWAAALNITFFVNSAAHLWGTSKPYDKNIYARDNMFLSILTNGEAWHNYHHAFPYDYRAYELNRISGTRKIIDIFAMLGWAYDLRIASDEMINSRALRTGDGSRNIKEYVNTNEY